MENNPHKNKVHKILAHSYFFCFLFFLAGICLDFIFNFKIPDHFLVSLFGLIFLTLGTFLIFWAQKTTRNFKKDMISKEIFYRGPYRYTRNPTHWGLFFLILGFGFIAKAPFVILFIFFYFIIAKFVFLKQEETILENKYGHPYLEYKKMVKF